FIEVGNPPPPVVHPPKTFHKSCTKMHQNAPLFQFFARFCDTLTGDGCSRAHMRRLAAIAATPRLTRPLLIMRMPFPNSQDIQLPYHTLTKQTCNARIYFQKLVKIRVPMSKKVPRVGICFRLLPGQSEFALVIQGFLNWTVAASLLHLPRQQEIRAGLKLHRLRSTTALADVHRIEDRPTMDENWCPKKR